MSWLVQSGKGWSLGIGDPTPIGWFTVFAYGLASVLTLVAWRRTLSTEGPGRVAWAWLCFGVLMALLGINKQLDLQSLFTVLARDLAKQQGWYDVRHLYQRAFILGIAALSMAGAAVFGWIMRRALLQVGLSAVGVGFISAFVVVRAASFHHVDLLLGAAGGLVNRLFELGGIGLVGLGAAVFLRSRRTGASGVPAAFVD